MPCLIYELRIIFNDITQEEEEKIRKEKEEAEKKKKNIFII